LNEETFSSPVLPSSKDGQELGENSNPSLENLFAPLSEHLFGQGKDWLSKLAVEDL